MTPKPRPDRTTLLDSADVQALTRWQRILRLQFRRPNPASTPPPVSAQSAPGHRDFQEVDEGSGIFGRWSLDDANLPVYEYNFDQYKDARAAYPNTEKLDRRDHWHQIGNSRITALASNDGTVQVYLGDRGGVFLNRFEAWHSERGGGILSVFIRIVVTIVRFLARLSAPKRVDLAQPFAAQAEAVIGAEPRQPLRNARNPRNTLPLQFLQRGEVLPESLLQSYSMLAGQNEPIVASAQEAARPQSRNHHATRYAYAGGFAFIDDGQEVWATAYRYAPAKAQITRRFGLGYADSEMIYRNLRITRRVYAPFGDSPYLLVDVFIENLSAEPVKLRHYEYWDINVHQMRVEWIRSGPFGPSNDEERRALNRQFTNSIAYLPEENALQFRQDPPADAPPPDQPSPVDWYPAPVFLADLTGTPDAHYINKAAFFGEGGASQPDAVRLRGEDTPFQPNSPLEPMPYCMVLRRDIELEGEGVQSLRFAYGAAMPDERRRLLEDLNPEAPYLRETQEDWRYELAHFSTGEDPVLHREMAWHSYNLLSSTVYSRFHDVHLIPQGSAYLYLHGADGAPRDQALFTLPMVYLNPELAQDMLRLIMRLTDRLTGQITYSFTGHGYITNGLNIHTSPSDLDLFFLLAMCEYLTATRDFDFLSEEVPFYPPGKPTRAQGLTVADHIRFALKHLFESVGIGDHDLIRVRSGDWSDSIVLETAVRDGLLGIGYQNSKAHGESIPNTQMALYILPLLANLLERHVPDITETINDGRLDRLRAGLERQWNPAGWYNRAVLRGVNNDVIKVDSLSLEAQVWGLISGAAAEAGHESTLIERVEAILDRPSPIGATLTPNGMTWPAISHLLTWGYARSGRSGLAWRSLCRNTFAVHAEQYPAIWFGIWSGPDAFNGLDSALPGGTWESPITPMTDFPAMNANPDSMALLALIRVCGIEPSPRGDGLIIRPQVPRDRFVLDLPLLYLEVDRGKIRGEYRARRRGQMHLYLYPPGAKNPVVRGIAFYAGQRVSFES